MNNYKGFTELEVYKKGRKLRQLISILIKKFPKEERYELISQIKRSSRSVTAKIAEGYGRYTYTDTRHLTTAFDEKYILIEELKTEWEK